jgi:hypothetical protein
MTTNADAIQMLHADTYWRRKQTSSFLFQIFLMRLAALNKAKLITKPDLSTYYEQPKNPKKGLGCDVY